MEGRLRVAPSTPPPNKWRRSYGGKIR